MAGRRMFDRGLIINDTFFGLSKNAQLLFWFLSISTDDEGFCGNPSMIMRMADIPHDALNELESKKYVTVFETGPVLINTFYQHNTLKKDRIKPTTFVQEKSLVKYSAESKLYYGSKLVPERIQTVSNTVPVTGTTAEPSRSQSVPDSDPNKVNKLNQVKEIKEGASPSAEILHPISIQEEPYIPEAWERDIPKAYWNKFRTDDDYYAYADKHRDEILAVIEAEKHCRT